MKGLVDINRFTQPESQDIETNKQYQKKPGVMTKHCSIKQAADINTPIHPAIKISQLAKAVALAGEITIKAISQPSSKNKNYKAGKNSSALPQNVPEIKSNKTP